MKAQDLVECDLCHHPMVPNVSTEDEDGYGWACVNPSCPDGGEQMSEVEVEDLVLAGCPKFIAESWVKLRDQLEELGFEGVDV